MFTYVTFHLSEPPYSLSTAALGWLFVVYLVGAAVTPLAGGGSTAAAIAAPCCRGWRSASSARC